MADETDTMINADALAVVEAPIAPKKQRKPRAKKAAPEPTLVDIAAATVAGKQKRGRKAKVIEGAAVAKRTPVKRAPKDKQTATVVATSAGDQLADLLQLEEENKKLRKMLADKLRAENSDLRKKLQLG